MWVPAAGGSWEKVGLGQMGAVVQDGGRGGSKAEGLGLLCTRRRSCTSGARVGSCGRVCRARELRYAGLGTSQGFSQSGT